MKPTRALRTYASLFAVTIVLSVVSAQCLAQSPAAEVNRGTVSIISGGVKGTYVRVASDLASVLDAEDLRVLTVLGKGSLKNIEDLLYLKGIDLAIVQSDVLEFIKRNQVHPDIDRQVRYISKLYNEEVHILARQDLADIADLAGRKVNVDGRGSGTAITASIVFDTLGIAPELVYDDQETALEKLKNRQIDALVYVAGKPTRLFQELMQPSGLKFLPIDLTPDLLETYLPTRLGHDDYPLLIGADEGIATLAVGAVLATYNWRPGSRRYVKVERLVSALFEQFETLLNPPWHPKWREVSLAAMVPGWSRFIAAEQRLGDR